jgi:hypothetical protein
MQSALIRSVILSLMSQGAVFGTRRELISLRKQAFDAANPLVKVAFDTRRIDQETEFNPRRGLQNYSRSEAFLNEANAGKLVQLKKLRGIVEALKTTYGREPEWQDSYCRVLLNTLNQSLNKDPGETQASIGSLDYVEEMLFTRYRLDMDSIAKYADNTLRDIVLNKDEVLLRKSDLMPAKEKPNNLMITQGYDTLLDKLFSVKATSENPNVERSITIIIKDSIADLKKSG